MQIDLKNMDLDRCNINRNGNYVYMSNMVGVLSEAGTVYE